MNKKEYELIKFEDGDFSLDVRVKEDNSIWLTQKDMSKLFDVSTDNIGLHIKNIIEECMTDGATTEKSSVVQTEGKRIVTRHINLYNLIIILEVGHRVKSNRKELFRIWALELWQKQKQKNASFEPIMRFEYDDACLDVTVSPDKETVWLTQAQICELFDSSKANISEHINNILLDNELDFNSVVRNFRTTGTMKRHIMFCIITWMK